LIEEALNVDNLRMEEAGQRELRTLLQALKISVERVKVALGDVDLCRHGIKPEPS
jgi:hypothetical protein